MGGFRGKFVKNVRGSRPRYNNCQKIMGALQPPEPPPPPPPFLHLCQVSTIPEQGGGGGGGGGGGSSSETISLSCCSLLCARGPSSVSRGASLQPMAQGIGRAKVVRQ